MNRRFFLSSLLGVFLPSCGSSNGGVGTFNFGPAIPGKKLVFGYYSCDDKQVEETRDHTNLVWISGFGQADSFTNKVNQLRQVEKSDITRVVLSVEELYQPGGEILVRNLLSSLQNMGLLKNIYALFPIDEPDNHGINVEQVVAKNTLLRQICQDYIELKDCPLFGTYGGNRSYPGVESFDIVAFDDYDSRGDIFAVAGEFDNFKSQLKASQRIFLICAGADTWKQDPEIFYRKALSDPQVDGIIAFLWINRGAENTLGIRNNGMAPKYQALGKLIKGANP